MPASGDPFQWRVSVAHIDASGPFSDFPAYDRKMVLLKGGGIELRFGDGSRRVLRAVGELVEFDGGLATFGELLEGPCVDLNLMIGKKHSAMVRVERLTEARIGASRDQIVLVFPIDAGVSLLIDDAQTVALKAWDLAVLSGGAAQLKALDHAPRDEARAHGAEGSAPSSAAVFLATLELAGPQSPGLGGPDTL